MVSSCSILRTEYGIGWLTCEMPQTGVQSSPILCNNHFADAFFPLIPLHQITGNICLMYMGNVSVRKHSKSVFKLTNVFKDATWIFRRQCADFPWRVITAIWQGRRSLCWGAETDCFKSKQSETDGYSSFSKGVSYRLAYICMPSGRIIIVWY